MKHVDCLTSAGDRMKPGKAGAFPGRERTARVRASGAREQNRAAPAGADALTPRKSHRQEVGVFFRSLKRLSRWVAGTSTAVMLAASPAALPRASAQENPDYKAILQRLE